MNVSLDYASQLDLWSRWLGYRWPHYDQMETAAAKTLTPGGVARVRVGFDARTNEAAECHLSLFTRTSETPDPRAAVKATLDLMPAGMVLHHIVTDHAHEHELTPPDSRAASTARAVTAATHASTQLRNAWDDRRAPARAREQLDRTAHGAARQALLLIEEAIADGLLLREHFLLVPPMVIKRDMREGMDLYVAGLATRAAFAGTPISESVEWQPPNVLACRACTLVFVPRRRGTVYCKLCRKGKRPASSEVVGQRALAPGDRQTVRVPERIGNVLIGWKTATMGLCVECGGPFIARRDAEACQQCSNKLRQRRHRRRR